MIRVENRTQLPVPPSRVWEALLAFELYPRWHPYLRLQGEAAPGAELELQYTRQLVTARRRRAWVKVQDYQPHRRFEWGLGSLALVRVREGFALESHAGGTQLLHWYEYRGLVALLGGETVRSREEKMVRETDAALSAYLINEQRKRGRKALARPSQPRRRPR